MPPSTSCNLLICLSNKEGKKQERANWERLKFGLRGLIILPPLHLTSAREPGRVISSSEPPFWNEVLRLLGDGRVEAVGQGALPAPAPDPHPEKK